MSSFDPVAALRSSHGLRGAIPTEERGGLGTMDRKFIDVADDNLRCNDEGVRLAKNARQVA